MPIIRATVENSDELLNAAYLGAGALGRVERSATGGGAGYSEIATFPLVAGTRVYTVYDLTGTVSSWYRVRYSKADGTSPSSYGDEFQTGDEDGGLISSLYDVKQDLGIAASDTTEDENLIEKIRDVGAEIMDYTGRRFVRNPQSGTATFLLQATSDGQTLYVPQGIAALTTLEVAVTSQPETGGTYTTVTAANVFLRPYTTSRSLGWPATVIEISDTSGSQFYAGQNTVRIVGALGWDKVPRNIAAIARRAVAGAYLAKGSGRANEALIGPTGAMVILRGISPEDHATLNRYRTPSLA